MSSIGEKDSPQMSESFPFFMFGSHFRSFMGKDAPLLASGRFLTLQKE